MLVVAGIVALFAAFVLGALFGDRLSFARAFERDLLEQREEVEARSAAIRADLERGSRRGPGASRPPRPSDMIRTVREGDWIKKADR